MSASTASSGKRPRSLSRSPHERPAKRRAPSPEEGELDEPGGRPPPEPTAPHRRNSKPMPFKTKSKPDGERRGIFPPIGGDRYNPNPGPEMGWMPPTQYHQYRGRGVRPRGMDSYRPSDTDSYNERDRRRDYSPRRARSPSPHAHGRPLDNGWAGRATRTHSPAEPMHVDEPPGPPPPVPPPPPSLPPPPPSEPAPPLPPVFSSTHKRLSPPLNTSPRAPKPADLCLMPPPPPPKAASSNVQASLAPSAHHTPASVVPVLNAPKLTPSRDPRISQPVASLDKSSLNKPKRTPRPWTTEDDKRAYGRSFASSKVEDYNFVLKIGEGTFGEVHKAVHKERGETVALKRIFMHNESEGVPVTALREIRILKMLKHENILPLYDMIITRPKDNEKRKSGSDLYMIFPYMDYDLAGLLENKEVKLTPSIIKMFMLQLCKGTEYLHHNRILHRDMKAANLLIARSGRLIIADFGLARPCDASDLPSDGRDFGTRFTNLVVTRWYRPPELLLGARYYGGAVDLWGIGCIFAEMFIRTPILRGNTDGHQFELIVELCGTPTSENWPDCPAFRPDAKLQEEVPPPHKWPSRPRRVDDKLRERIIDPLARDLLDRLLILDPGKRLTASDALDHDYFCANPPPMELGKFPQWAPSHEYDKRRNIPLPAPNFPTGPPPLPPYLPQQNGHGHGPGHMHRPGPPGRGGRGGGHGPHHQWAGPPQHGRPHPPGPWNGGPGPPQHQPQAGVRPPWNVPINPLPPDRRPDADPHRALPRPITFAKHDGNRRMSGHQRGGGAGGSNVRLNY